MAKSSATHTKQNLQIGPFIGGINNYSDPAAIADNELVDCINYEVSLDGSLVSRPPIQSITNKTDWTDRIRLLLVASIGGNQYIFGSNADGVWYYSSGSWTEVTSAFFASAAVQYNDTVYLLPNSNNGTYALAKWTPSGGFADVTPANLKTMMGSTYGGSKLLIYNSRLFIVPGPLKTNNPSRLIFSDAGNPESFSASTQFVDVNPGDGQALHEAIVQDDNLLLFKSESTYVFTFTSTPADAELIRINNIVGAQWQRCAVSFENAVYVLHRGRVFEIVNYNFQNVSIKVPFVQDTSAPSTRNENVFLCRIRDRLIVRWWNRVYVFHLRTRTWTRWESEDSSLHNFGSIVGFLSSSTEAYYAGSSLSADKHMFQIGWTHNSTDEEEIDGTPVDISCSLQTKHYDLADAYHFKRLHWWGVDALSTNDITGTVESVVAVFLPSWGDWGDQYTWADLDKWGTFVAETVTSTLIETDGLGKQRSFYRFPKSTRFRKVNFTVETTTSGSTIDGPVRVFGLNLIGSVRQVVGKGIN